MQDLKWAIRSLRKNPGFTFLALATLVVGIAATTVAFAVLNAVVLRPLPYRASDRLVFIRESTRKHDLRPPSFPNFISWRERARSFEGVASAMFPFARTVRPAGSDTPLRAMAMGVSNRFFAILGVTPLVGREFTAEESSLGGPPAAMVTYEFWRDRMGGRRPLGTIRLGDVPTPVVGVLPPNFRFISTADLFFPHEQMPGTVRSSHNYMVVARLRPSVTLATARAEMSAISRALLAQYGTETEAADADVTPLREYLTAGYRVLLSIVFAAGVLVLLIACTNLVSAQLARGWHREREIVVRAALGASRSRIARQLVLESGLLVAAGTAIALALALGATAAIRTAGGTLVPRLTELSIDARVMTFVISIAALTALITGVYPALRLSRRDAGLVLRGTHASSAVRVSVWRLLVGFEVALAVMLLIGATLLVRTLRNILTSDTGFQPNGLITASLVPQEADTARIDELLAGIRAVPGVEGAAFTSKLPLMWGNGSGPVRRPGDPLDRDYPAMAGFRVVTPDYFSVLDQPVLRGRAFTRDDRAGAPEVAIITTGIAQKLWPGENPIGKTIATNYLFTEWLTVVGVVAEASSWTMPRGSQNEIYVPLAQHVTHTEGQLVAIVRAAPSTTSVIPSLRTRLRQLLPQSPATIATMDDRIEQSAADRRFAMMAITAFGLVALVLAAVGIYGVICYIVATRTPEIGIRMALGASASRVQREMLGNAAAMAAAGIVVGLAGGAFATKYLQSTLYGVSRTDPVVYAGCALAALVITLLAAYGPARTSTRIDPMIVIRSN